MSLVPAPNETQAAGVKPETSCFVPPFPLGKSPPLCREHLKHILKWPDSDPKGDEGEESLSFLPGKEQSVKGWVRDANESSGQHPCFVPVLLTEARRQWER